MSETSKLLMEKDGPLGWIIFNQPEKRNAVSQEMWELMPGYVQELASADPNCKGVNEPLIAMLAIQIVADRGGGPRKGGCC
jgi:hypothetical protein